MFEQFAGDARAVVRKATEEARIRGDRRVGTDHLLLGLLNDKEASAFLGVSLAQARAAARALDVRALAAIGLIDDGLFPSGGSPSTGRLLFTAGAREVVRRTLTHATGEKSRQITVRHLTAALLERQAPDAANALLAELQVDRGAVRSRL